MKKISKIVEDDGIFGHLQKRNLLKQYQKMVQKLLLGDAKSTGFKLRNPKSAGIWQFRVNKKYRALGFFENDDFVVFEIYDHQ